MAITSYKAALPVTPSSAALPLAAKALYAGGAGTVAVEMADGSAVTFTVARGRLLKGRFAKVLASSTATGIIALGDTGPADEPLSYLVDTDGAYLTDTAGNRQYGTGYVDDPALSLRSLAASKGIMFGTSSQGAAVMGAAGPAGFATRLDWMASEVDLVVPGSVMMPDNFNPSLGSFTMSALTAWLDDMRARGLKVRGHCSWYPKRDIGTWIDTYLQANPSEWQTVLAARIDALCAVLVNYLDIIVNIDGVNEVFGVGSANAGGWRTDPWSTAVAVTNGRTVATATVADYQAPVIYALQRLRAGLPGVDIYWCSDLQEQITGTVFDVYVANILSGIAACKAAGAPVDGFAMQAHLTNRLGFDAVKLRAFCRSLTETLGLKLIVSELDTHTGAGAGFNDTRTPAEYTVPEYDRVSADYYKRFLDIALPFVVASGGRQLLSWTLDDGYNSWTDAYGQPPGERPCPFDATYAPKPQYYALRNALLEL